MVVMLFKSKRGLDMRVKGITAVALALLLVCMSTSAFALDGTRKGFILGFSVGGGYQSYTVDIDVGSESESTERQNHAAIATDFRIGGGITEQFTLYYANRLAWFGVSDDVWVENFTAAFGVGLVGVSYYFKTTAPSWYILGTIGTATWLFPFEDDTGTAGGFGLSGGLGYEFAKHWAFEGTVNWGQPKDDPLTINALAVLFTIGGTWY
jgi:hypothetical protein